MNRMGGIIDTIRTTDPLKDKWWITLIIPYLVLGVQFATIRVLDASAHLSSNAYILVIQSLGVLAFVTLGLSILGLYFDIVYCAEVSEWKPTMWYSLMIFTPGVGVAIMLHYLYKRSKYVGL